MSLDALVKEIHVKYTQAMKEFFAVVDNVLSIDGTQNFERAFFRFRTVVKVGLIKKFLVLKQKIKHFKNYSKFLESVTPLT